MMYTGNVQKIKKDILLFYIHYKMIIFQVEKLWKKETFKDFCLLLRKERVNRIKTMLGNNC